MARTMYAVFSDDAYDAFVRGDAVDNNGLRSKKGNFYPDQPTFRVKLSAKEQLQEFGVDLTAEVVCRLVHEVVCPAIKRFASEKVYPAIERKWDDWLGRRANKKTDAGQRKTLASVCIPNHEIGDSRHNKGIINLEDYMKGA